MGMSGIVAEPASSRTERGGAGAVAGEGREGLDLFLRRRGAALIGSIGESGAQNGPIKNVNVGSATTGRSRLDDLLDAEMGKHDYDWLLTPPGTPIFPSSDASENQIMSTTTNNRSTVKSASTARSSRDIRQSMGGIRATSIFPHSIRSSAPKARSAHCSEPIVPVTNEELADAGSCNKIVSEDGNGAFMENVDIAAKLMNRDRLVAKESDFDLYGSSRYDAMLLKEDLKNTNWLHNIDDKSDQSPVFDHRFESLPEPFSPL